MLRSQTGFTNCPNNVSYNKRTKSRITFCIKLKCLFSLLQSGTVLHSFLDFMTLITLINLIRTPILLDQGPTLMTVEVPTTNATRWELGLPHMGLGKNTKIPPITLSRDMPTLWSSTSPSGLLYLLITPLLCGHLR